MDTSTRWAKALSLAAIGLAAAFSAAGNAPRPDLPQFDVRQIAPLNPDVPYVAGTALNDAGQVLGSSWLYEETPHAFITGPAVSALST